MEHVADIQIPEDNNRTVKEKFKRMSPMRLSKYKGKINKAKGNFENILEHNKPIKIRRLTKFTPKKAQ